MSDNLQTISHDIWVDGRKMAVKVQLIANNSLRVSWTNPTNFTAYNGAVILLSENRFSPEEYPEDGKRYTPSTNFIAPADKIGQAQVIAAQYGYFNDDLTVTSVDVSNIDPTKIYYASIHAASNILQYHAAGVQSYAIETTGQERLADTYAGNIPSQSTPPDNPSNGQTYYDHTSSKVLIWNDATSTWLETSTDTVPTGAAPPVAPKQLFYNTHERKLQFFINGVWADCNAQNTRVKFGSGFAPLGIVHNSKTENATTGDLAYYVGIDPLNGSKVSELSVFTLGQWINFTPNLFQFQTGPDTWTTCISGESVYGSYTPAIPAIGDFFYKTVGRDLLVWDGDGWTKADTEGEGNPTTDKIGIGTDGSYDERLRLIKVLKGQLGWPKVCVELDEEHFNVAIDNAMEEFRRRADNAYTNRYIIFTLKKDQSVYYLNDPRLKTDRIVNVLKIHRVSQSAMNALGGSNIYSQPFIEQFFNGGQIDLVSVHLVSQLAETFTRIFAGELGFSWDETSRQLTILRDIRTRSERVVVEAVMERTEQELLQDRWAKQWLQGWALAELKEVLGMIRTKYGSVAGPNGGLTLNGDMLISEARMDFDDLLRQILDYEVGNGGVNFGNTAFFIG